MKCDKCVGECVYISPTLCKRHFISHIENKVYQTIKKNRLIKSKEKIIIAASGGKDSLTLLYILSKKYKVDCIAVDEGIKNYREITLTHLKKFCRKNNIKLNIPSYKEEFGKTLPQFLTGNTNPCTPCGVLRRYLLNKYSKKYNKLCTGHNLDDEAQSIIMNFIKPNINALSRIGPITGTISHKGFVQRVKPLYFIKEKEIVTYAFLNRITYGDEECLYAVYSYRAKIRDMLNEYEAKYPGTKQNIIDFFLKISPKLKKSILTSTLNLCIYCHEPANREICNTCRIIKELS